MWELELEGNVEDITRIDDVDRRYMRTTTDWSAYVEGFWETSVAPNYIALADTEISVTFDMNDTDGKKYDGKVFVTNYVVTQSVSGAVAYRLEGQGTGELEVTDT